MTFAQAVVYVVGNWRKQYGDGLYVPMLVFMAVASGINTKRAIMKTTLLDGDDVASCLRKLKEGGAVAWSAPHKKYMLTAAGKAQAEKLFSLPK